MSKDKYEIKPEGTMEKEIETLLSDFQSKINKNNAIKKIRQDNLYEEEYKLKKDVKKLLAVLIPVLTLHRQLNDSDEITFQFRSHKIKIDPFCKIRSPIDLTEASFNFARTLDGFEVQLDLNKNRIDLNKLKAFLFEISIYEDEFIRAYVECVESQHWFLGKEKPEENNTEELIEEAEDMYNKKVNNTVLLFNNIVSVSFVIIVIIFIVCRMLNH